jgi:DNA-binding transcriptional MerR regulator
MSGLIKISELSEKYGITTRTLRYYEDTGIIQSRRTGDYAYRMYDGEAVKRLEQILILRKLNISIKDIKRIFNAPDSEVILEVLNKKVSDIDEEAGLLHELKEMVLKFIVQIKQADFSKDSDVKMLYEKANEIEGQIADSDAAVDLGRLVEVSDKLAEAAEARMVSANDTLIMRNFKKATGNLALVAQEVENFCIPYDTLNPKWEWHSPEFKNVKWLGMKDMIKACEEAAKLTAEINAVLGEPRSEFKDSFKPLSPTPPKAQEFALEDLKSYIAGFKRSIEMANAIIAMEKERHLDYILGSSPVELNSEEEIEEIRSNMKSMADLCKDIAAAMEKIGEAIDDPDSKLNRSLTA